MTNHLTHNNSVMLSIGLIVFKGSGGSRSWDKWGAGSQKILFSVLRASVWSKNKGLVGGLSLGSTTEGSGPGRGKLELLLLSNVSVVASQRFISKESYDIYTFPVNRTITHVFEPSQLFLYQKSWPCLGQAHVIEYTLRDKKEAIGQTLSSAPYGSALPRGGKF